MSVMRVIASGLLAVALAGAYGAQLLRWLRVLQREHYEPASMIRFLGRWSSPTVASAKSIERFRSSRPFTRSHVFMVALLVAAVLQSDLFIAALSALYGLTCPQGLTIRGRTSALHWTRRATTIAGLTIVVGVAVAMVSLATPRVWLGAAAMVWAVPLVLDVVVRVLAPYERRSANRFVRQASAQLARVHPRVVAITGSFGKTSTKNHLADILGSGRGVVASPRSFNNRAGLSRAVNEHLSDDAQIFIAEMGTYGPGEIRDLTSWCVPDISIVTAIGPVHLERMKSLEVIDRAKFEITERAPIVVLNVDDPRLSRWVSVLEMAGKKVRTAGSANSHASVLVREDSGQWRVSIDGQDVAECEVILGVQVTNVACAIAGALELGVETSEIAEALRRIGPIANRSNVVVAPSGVTVIDDTFNANPSSAAAALSLLSSLSLTGRRVVITPGMIELGVEQYRENALLARQVSAMNAELVIVGRTNVRPLVAGFDGPVTRFDTREEAVAWVRSALGPADGVLYLNDLPDHYP